MNTYEKINSREQISSLFADYLNTHYEWVRQFWTSEAAEWSGKRQAIYVNGVVFGKYREHHLETIQTMSRGVTDLALREEIAIKCSSRIEILKYKKNPDMMDNLKINSEKRLLKELSEMPLDDWIIKNCQWVENEFETTPYPEFRVFLYLYYAFENFNVEKHHICCADSDQIDSIYRNIFDRQSQFYKYGLLPIDKSRELLVIDPPRIYDKSVNKTLFVKNIPVVLLKELLPMVSDRTIENLSVRVSNSEIFDQRMDSGYLAEALERGKIFDFENLGTFSITKLYSNVYGDCLWVNMDSNNITFEELCENFHIYKEVIVTQVIHLQYIKDSAEAYITHLDHEYIFYTMDEYEIRMKDVNQKGTARPRMKSFKIDNAKIPFSIRCKVVNRDEHGNEMEPTSVQFLCYVLECYFSHVDLLKEYFEKVI